MKKYNPQTIEKKWQKYWEEKQGFKAADESGKDTKYILVEFPYPSGAGLHMGHLRPYVAGDVYARYMRLKGFETLFPIGWDAFGLPAENYAIKNGVQPAVSTAENIKNAKKQITSWGLSFDWSREINTTDPNYYKWTQWIFLQFFKRGLAYEATGPINWCPKDKTGLANEEVIDGKCERCGTVVEKKNLRQWYLKITAYADKLLQGLKELPEWPEQVKSQQENWIGKSVGAEIDFPIANPRIKRIVILHGRQSTSKDHFYPWLKRELEAKGFIVEAPTLPRTGEPNADEQADYVQKNVKLDASTVVIGHSLGGVVAMRLLERGIKVHGVVFAATPMTGKFLDGKVRASVTDAVMKGFNFGKIRKNADYFKILTDGTDSIVPSGDAKILAEQLDTLNQIVTAEKPHFTGRQEPTLLNALLPNVKVFTTRPDTIYGATYMVLAPEHPLVQSRLGVSENKAQIQKYIQESKAKSEMVRTALDKEKTGVELKGVKVINPATKEEIPVWVADYVLGGYGTGAIMAVPAHDERDFEFASKFRLRIQQVVEPVLVQTTGSAKFREDEPVQESSGIIAIIKHWSENKFIGLRWPAAGWGTFLTGGIDEGLTAEETVKKEILEETGYKNVVIVRKLGNIHSKYYHEPKKMNRFGHAPTFYVELENGEKEVVSDSEKARHELVWLTTEELKTFLTATSHLKALEFLDSSVYTGPGLLINSGEFNGIVTEQAIPKMAEKFGKVTVQYKLRDWLFSRQRYWGEPIPVVHCEKCGIVGVPEEDLPVTLPEVEKYEPTGTGESPLAGIDEWVNTTCPNCQGPAKREINTMPQWAGSSWYWLRYTDPQNKKELSSNNLLKRWTPVDVYFGGMEHTTLHLLYSRFWNLFLYDEGIVTAKEPYAKRVPHGIILGPDGDKMSKSKGNVVNPDDIVKQYGADTLRMYELFLGPHEATVKWDDKGIIGVKRFLDRVWMWVYQQIKLTPSNSPLSGGGSLQNSQKQRGASPPEKEGLGEVSDSDIAERAINKLIKKVGEDIEEFRFNTCISAMMEFLNVVKDEQVSLETIKKFLIVLYPFAPHIAEELHQIITPRLSSGSSSGNKTLQFEPWPTFDSKKVVDEMVEIVVQINGRVKDKIAMPLGSNETDVVDTARQAGKIKSLLVSEPKRVIFVRDRLVNFVV